MKDERISIDDKNQKEKHEEIANNEALVNGVNADLVKYIDERSEDMKRANKLFIHKLEESKKDLNEIGERVTSIPDEEPIP